MKTLYYSILLFTLFSFLDLRPAKGQIPQQKRETRGVWLTTVNGLDWPRTKATGAASRERQKTELIRILDQYQQLHLNTVLLQTRVRGSMIYPSAQEGWDPCLTGTAGMDPGYDPLQFAIDECHKRGMELHCWMVTIPSGNAKVHKQLGEKSVTRTHPEICRCIRDYWYLDPGHPQTKYYIAGLCREIIERYDVDGIHFDFIRYPEHNANLLDQRSYKEYGNGKERSDWRRDNITAIVREAYRTVKEIKPWVKVTSAPLGKYRDTSRFPSGGWNGYHKVFQDAQRWMKEGIMDGLYPMLYYRGNNFYPFVHDWKENACGRPVIPGLGIYFMHPSEGNWSLSDIQREMNYCRSLGMGIAHYRSKFLTDNTRGLYDWCNEYYYPYPSLTPAMTWIDDTTPAAPEQLEIRQEEGREQLQWSACTDTLHHTYVTYNVYRSRETPVDTENPAHLIAARLMENRYEVTLPEGGESSGWHYAVTASDRFGNESLPVQDVRPLQLGGISYSKGMLRVPAVRGAVRLLIADLTGNVVRSINYGEETDVSTLERGSYQVSVQFPDGRKKKLGFFLK